MKTSAGTLRGKNVTFFGKVFGNSPLPSLLFECSVKHTFPTFCKLISVKSVTNVLSLNLLLDFYVQYCSCRTIIHTLLYNTRGGVIYEPPKATVRVRNWAFCRRKINIARRVKVCRSLGINYYMRRDGNWDEFKLKFVDSPS